MMATAASAHSTNSRPRRFARPPHGAARRDGSTRHYKHRGDRVQQRTLGMQPFQQLAASLNLSEMLSVPHQGIAAASHCMPVICTRCERKNVADLQWLLKIVVLGYRKTLTVRGEQ
jgi:hypothetical protein